MSRNFQMVGGEMDREQRLRDIAEDERPRKNCTHDRARLGLPGDTEMPPRYLWCPDCSKRWPA